MKEDICKRIKNIRNSLEMNKNEFASLLRCFTTVYWNCGKWRKLLIYRENNSIS